MCLTEYYFNRKIKCWSLCIQKKNITVFAVSLCYAVFTCVLWAQVSLLCKTSFHPCFLFASYLFSVGLIIPPATKLGGVYWIQPVCLSVCPSVRLSVCPLTFSCPPCSIYSSGWILSIYGTNDQWHERVCRMWWPLTLTYIFKVIWPWIRKSCPLCSIYSSGWINFLFGTNDHY